MGAKNIKGADSRNNADLYQLLELMRVHANRSAFAKKMLQLLEDAMEHVVVVKKLFPVSHEFGTNKYKPIPEHYLVVVVKKKARRMK